MGNNDHYTWTISNIGLEHLETYADDGARIEFYVNRDYVGQEPTFVVWDAEGRKAVSTDDSADWPKVERYVPRSEWPEPMFVGQHGPKERRPDSAIVQYYLAERLEEFEDEETE